MIYLNIKIKSNLIYTELYEGTNQRIIGSSCNGYLV